MLIILPVITDVLMALFFAVLSFAIIMTFFSERTLEKDLSLLVEEIRQMNLSIDKMIDYLSTSIYNTNKKINNIIEQNRKNNNNKR